MKKQDIAQKLMREFAKRTCINEEGCTPLRYLWTDAFAVCNYIGLYRATGDEYYKGKAIALVDEVHHILGRHRSDDPDRRGWISRLDENEGEMHPTVGGLRIGKKRDERKVGEPHHEKLEWEQDGQYFHYLTKWMHALSLMTELTGDKKYHCWAVELAKTAYEKFTYTTFTHERRMYWKMSIDLSYPLISSMGQHDALDGLIIFLSLQPQAFQYCALSLGEEIEALEEMASLSHMGTNDPLGLGGMLSDACLLMLLISKGGQEDFLSDLLVKILHHSQIGIEKFLATQTLNYHAQYRLAFRELGLSIGLHGLERMKRLLKENALFVHDNQKIAVFVDQLLHYLPLCKVIEDFWLNPENQKSTTWLEYLDINSVMLATSLSPDGYFLQK